MMRARHQAGACRLEHRGTGAPAGCEHRLDAMKFGDLGGLVRIGTTVHKDAVGMLAQELVSQRQRPRLQRLCACDSPRRGVRARKPVSGARGVSVSAHEFDERPLRIHMKTRKASAPPPAGPRTRSPCRRRRRGGVSHVCQTGSAAPLDAHLDATLAAESACEHAAGCGRLQPRQGVANSAGAAGELRRQRAPFTLRRRAEPTPMAKTRWPLARAACMSLLAPARFLRRSPAGRRTRDIVPVAITPAPKTAIGAPASISVPPRSACNDRPTSDSSLTQCIGQRRTPVGASTCSHRSNRSSVRLTLVVRNRGSAQDTVQRGAGRRDAVAAHRAGAVDQQLERDAIPRYGAAESWIAAITTIGASPGAWASWARTTSEVTARAREAAAGWRRRRRSSQAPGDQIEPAILWLLSTASRVKRCVGQSTTASASTPASMIDRASGYSTSSDVAGTCWGCRPADSGSP